MSTNPTAQLDRTPDAASETALARPARARGKARGKAGARPEPFVPARRLAPVAANDEPKGAWTAEAARAEPDEAAAMSALGEPIRRELVERLLEEPTSVGRLAEHFPVSRAAISQHLKVLLDAGVVGYHKRGPLNVYSVNAEPLIRLESYLHELSLRARARGARRRRWYEPA